jgi:hypothetical protein
MQIIQSKITRQEMTEKFLTYFETMTKAVVDIKKEIIAIDADMHSDLEAALIETGSCQEDLWGINLYPSKFDDEFIEYTSLINIRPKQNNPSMEVLDSELKGKIKTIVDQWVVS